MCIIKDPNEISEDRIHKFSINLPPALYYKLRKKTNRSTVYGGRIAVFVREILEKSVAGEKIEEQKTFGFGFN